MGGGIPTPPPPFPSVEEALAAGKTQDEINKYLSMQRIEENNKETTDSPAPAPAPTLIDPWCNVPVATQLQLLSDKDDSLSSDITTITVMPGETTAAAVKAVSRLSNISNTSTLNLIMEDNTAETPLIIDTQLASCVVSLSYAQGGLNSFAANGPNVLRRLNLSGCPLVNGFASKYLESNLLILDLSFCEFSDISALDFSELHNLRHLALESCSIQTLQTEDDSNSSDGKASSSSPLQYLQKLQYLNVSDNELGDIDAVRIGLMCVRSSLTELDLRENELRETLGSKKYLNFLTEEVFHKLVKLDNKVLNQGVVGSTAMLSQTAGIREAIGGEDDVVNANEDRGSCSCLAGNACVEKYNCKDWKNRFLIAKEVRKNKGIEEIPGLQ